MKKFKILVLLLISNFAISQVGIGTTTPHSSSILDLTSTNKGLLLPRVANTAAIAAPTNGMMIYDVSSNCVKGYQNGAWSSCLSSGSSSVVVDCNNTSFNGTYFKNTAMNASNTFKVTIINYGTTTSNLTFANTDLVLSGANAGLSVGTVSPASVALASGASTTVTYTLSGNNTTTTGTLTGTWTKTGMTCTKTVEVKLLSITSPLACDSPTNVGNLIELLPASGVTSTITYNSSNGTAHTGQIVASTGVTGLTATLNAGTFTTTGGTLTYTITGTPAEVGIAYFAIDIGGQQCTLTRTVTPPLANVPATISLGKNRIVIIPSGLDYDFLPYKVPTAPATLGSSPANGVNEISIIGIQSKIGPYNTTDPEYYISVRIPVIATASGNLAAYTSPAVDLDPSLVQGTVGMKVQLKWDAVSYTTATKFIDARIVGKQTAGVFYTTGLDSNIGIGSDYKGIPFATFFYPTDNFGNISTVESRIIGIIPDKMHSVSYTNDGNNAGNNNYGYFPVVGEDGKIWLSRNLGCSDCTPGITSFDDAPTIVNQAGIYGNYFQWGRAPYGHQSLTFASTSIVKTNDASIPIGVQSFVYSTPSASDWRLTRNDNLWISESSPSNPCPKGFRVPSVSEFLQYFVAAGVTNITTGFDADLIFPTAGYRSGASSGNSTIASHYYWTSEINGTNAKAVLIPTTGTSVITTSTALARGNGMQVRCIKD